MLFFYLYHILKKIIFINIHFDSLCVQQSITVFLSFQLNVATETMDVPSNSIYTFCVKIFIKNDYVEEFFVGAMEVGHYHSKLCYTLLKKVIAYKLINSTVKISMVTEQDKTLY